MSMCIQEWSQMAENLEEKRSAVVSIRFKPFEAARFWEVVDAVKARNPYVDRADVVRELMGLVPARALTEAEIRYFRTGERSGALRKAPVRTAKLPLIQPKASTNKGKQINSNIRGKRKKTR